MLQSAIAPALRALGFKGSRQTFELADERFWGHSSGSRNRSPATAPWSSSQSILCVIDKAQYSEAQEEASYLPPKPTPNIRGGPGWWERIGEVLPQRHDLWWSMGEGTPLPLLPNKSFWPLRRMVCRPSERGCSSCGSEEG